MGRIGVAEAFILLIVVGSAVAAITWIVRTIDKGKVRFELERRAREAPRSVQPSQPTHVVERVVERQVVVTRCAYCKKLTPVDLTACDGCGARL